MKKILNKLDSILFTLFITIFITLTLFYNLQMFIIYSGSMEPNIPKGSIVFSIKPKDTSLANYTKGQIITFKPYENNPKGYVTHRIFNIYKNQIFTKGDFNKAIDSWTIKPNQISGLYIFHIPYLGYLLHFLILYPWYLLIIIGLIYTFPFDDERLSINWPLLNKVTIIIIPLIITFWSLPAYAQFNGTSSINYNSFNTDTFYNYAMLTNNLNNTVPYDIQKDVVLDFGTVEKSTDFNNVLQIKNVSPNTINLNIIENSPYLSAWFTTSKKQTIILYPSDITTIALKINDKNSTINTDNIKLQLNNSNYYICNIRVNY